MKISRIIFVTLIFLASCGDNEPMKYQEYHRDATKTLFELLEFKAEFQKCYGKPLHYDAAAKHYVYNEFAFHGGDNLSHFSLIIQKLAVRLDAFIKRYQEKTPEREFVSLFIFWKLGQALQNAGEEIDKVAKGEFSTLPFRMGEAFYHMDKLESNEEKWFEKHEILIDKNRRQRI